MEAGVERRPYRHVGTVLIRATTHHDGLDLHDWPDLFGAPEKQVEQWCTWLARVWEQDEAREAVEIASPVLARQIREVRGGRRPAPRQIRKMVISLVSYLLRWKGRATPFGLFAGVAAAQVGTHPVVHWGGQGRVVARADADWLAAIIGRLEGHTGLLERLPVVVNSAAFVRDDRLVLPGGLLDDAPGEYTPREVSVRLARPVRTTVDSAQVPIQYGELVEKLAIKYPTAPRARIAGMLAELIARRVLLTSLLPPMTVTDALGYVLVQLAAADAGDLPDVAPIVQELREIHSELSRHNRGISRAVGGQTRAAVADRMRAVSDAVPQPLVIDVGLDCDIVLPESVIGEAEAAASALLRLTPYPFGSPAWKQWHSRFLDRYGVGATVPVRDLVQADTGLGMPADYLGSPYKRAPRPLTERDKTLLALVQRAVMDDEPEIVLTEPVIRTLTVGDPTEASVPPRAELAFRIHAASHDALRRGAFRLVVTGVPRTASSMTGRFIDLLDDPDHDRLQRAYAAWPTADADAVLAQLSFPPRRRRSENVIRAPQLIPRVISLSEHRTPGSDLIRVDDLAVSADARRLYLVSRATGERIEPVVLHALEARVQTPPLARFLAEIPTARSAVYGSFDWGAAARLPYLPRLRYGRTVLSAARWLISAADLPARGAPLSEWEAAVEAWRRRFRVPATVVLCESDLRLPLDLDNPLHRALLRSSLDRSALVELREAPTAEDLTWCGRAHEFLIPLRLASPSATSSPQPRRDAPPPTVTRDAGHLPGCSAWLYVQIHGHPDRQDEILTGHLPRLFAAWDGPPPLWWFRRFRDLTRSDAEEHLRLHVRLPSPGHYGAAAARIGDWAADMRGRGLVPHVSLGTYYPETDRYGFGAAMTAAEEAFAADSAVALAQMETAARTRTSPEAITVASFIDLAASFTGSLGDGMRWLIDHLPQEPATVDRTVREAAMRLADPNEDWAALRTTSGGESVVQAWEKRRTALAAYRKQLAQQRDPLPVLRSLLHMHHVRMLGVNPERERAGRRLARAAALRWTAHVGRGEQ